MGSGVISTDKGQSDDPFPLSPFSVKPSSSQSQCGGRGWRWWLLQNRATATSDSKHFLHFYPHSNPQETEFFSSWYAPNMSLFWQWDLYFDISLPRNEKRLQLFWNSLMICNICLFAAFYVRFLVTVMSVWSIRETKLEFVSVRQCLYRRLLQERNPFLP